MVGLHWLTGQQLNLPHKKRFLIVELVVVGAVFQEFRKELEQPLPVVDQDALHGYGFIRIGHEDLE